MKYQKKSWMKLCFYVYIVLLFIGVIIKFSGSLSNIIDRIESIRWNRAMGAWNLNLVPFRQVGSYLRSFPSPYAIQNILGNVVAFIPFGFFIPAIYTKSFKKAFIIAFLSILAIETFQLITMLGYFDIDDIILNMAGYLIGYNIYKAFHIKKTSKN